ncbi:MAG: SemiSWEET transporter [Acidobacteriota bacterium]
MNDAFIFTIGFGAAIGTTVAWLPQVVRTWSTRSARDFSWGYLALFVMGVSLWTLYGVLRRDPVVIVGNAITLLLVISVALVKAGERQSRREAPMSGRGSPSLEAGE